MLKTADRLVRRRRRHARLRRSLSGSPVTPRISVFRSARHIYAQAIDDVAGRTLAQASTCDKDLRGSISGYSGNKESAALVGKALAERLKKLGIENIVFDRGGNRYQGRVQSLADGAREGGLKF